MKNLASLSLVLVSLLTLSAYGGSDTIPLNKKESSSKAPAVSDSDITSKLKKSSGKKAEPVAGSAEDQVPKPYIASVGVFGTTRVNEVILRETLGKDFDKWIAKGLSGDEGSVALEAKLIEKLKGKYGFALVEFSVVQFFEPGDYAIHVVLDVVEKADVTKRMNFLPEPTQEFPDPDQLIKHWMEYENAALDLVEEGKLEPEAQKCAALHCPFGHEHPNLKKFGPIFTEGVKKHIDKLIEIQAKDKRPEFRAAATYLIPYVTDGKKIIPGMVERIRDSDPVVRNNALRVLGDIAEFHPEYVIPVQPIVQALSYPKASDRSKSIFVAYLMALNSSNARDELLKTAVPSLLDLLATKIPDQKEFAHNTLRKISGKDFPGTDVTSWRNWYVKLNRDRGVTGAK